MAEIKKTNKTNKYKFKKAFTLIELLIVVSVIGILAGTTIALINVDRQEEIAEEGVIRANLHGLAQGIEAFYAAEGRYPDSEADPALTTYVDDWPDTPGVYVYTLTDAPEGFTVYTQPTSGSSFFKYYSEWGEIRQCSDIDVDDPDSCIEI